MAALLGLMLMSPASVASPLEGFTPRPLWQPTKTPSLRYYRRISTRDGRVRGRSRSRGVARYALWSLDNGAVVRLQERTRGRVVLERRFDTLGEPVTSRHTPRDGWPFVVVHLVPDREIGISGWEAQQVPGGTVTSPVPTLDEGGHATAWVLGGVFEAWYDDRVVDVTTDAYWQGLLAGCGCDLVDRVVAYVDGRPGVRFRLARGADVQELWAIPVEDARAGVSGTWYASFLVHDVEPATTSLRMAPGRALAALVELDQLAELAPEPEAP